jgi:hypothetical protein
MFEAFLPRQHALDLPSLVLDGDSTRLELLFGVPCVSKSGAVGFDLFRDLDETVLR